MPPYPRYSRYSATMEILSFPFLFARKVSHAFQACALILLMCLIKQKFTEQAQTTCLPSAHINSIPQRTKLLYSIQIFHRFLLHVIQWGESLLPFFLRSFSLLTGRFSQSILLILRLFNSVLYGSGIRKIPCCFELRSFRLKETPPDEQKVHQIAKIKLLFHSFDFL